MNLVREKTKLLNLLGGQDSHLLISVSLYGKYNHLWQLHHSVKTRFMVAKKSDEL